MGFRRSFTGWVGAITVLFGIAFIAIAPSLPLLARGSVAVPLYNHGISVPLWGGILLILSGMAVVAEVLGRKRRNLAYSFFRFPLVSLMANLISFIVACIILAIFTWAMYEHFLRDANTRFGNELNLRGQALSIYATVVFMSVILLMVTLFAMFMDCCASFLVVPNAATDFRGPPPAVYDSRPAIIYK